MYVKKDELRTAVVARIAELKGTDEKPPVKTSVELRAEYDKLCAEIYDAQTERFQAFFVENPSSIVKVNTRDWYQVGEDRERKIRVTTTIKLDAKEWKQLIDEKVQMKAAYERWCDQSNAEYAGRNRRNFIPTSLRELEAWIARLDNDVKTATVNVKREFAQELGLI